MFAYFYNKNLSTFDEFLELDNSVSVHHKNLHCLTFELHKVVNGVSLDIMKDVSPLRDRRHIVFVTLTDTCH